jgi:hypothetical protein
MVLLNYTSLGNTILYITETRKFAKIQRKFSLISISLLCNINIKMYIFYKMHSMYHIYTHRK